MYVGFSSIDLLKLIVPYHSTHQCWFTLYESKTVFQGKYQLKCHVIKILWLYNRNQNMNRVHLFSDVEINTSV